MPDVSLARSRPFATNAVGAQTPPIARFFTPSKELATYPARAIALADEFARLAPQLAWICSLFRECMAKGEKPAGSEDDLPPSRLGITVAERFVILHFAQPRDHRPSTVENRAFGGDTVFFASLVAQMGEWPRDGVSLAHDCALALARLEAKTRAAAQAALDWRPGAPPPEWNAAQAKAHFRRDGEKLLKEAIPAIGFVARKHSANVWARGQTLELDAPASVRSLADPEPEVEQITHNLMALKLLGAKSLARVESGLLADEFANKIRAADTAAEAARAHGARSPSRL